MARVNYEAGIRTDVLFPLLWIEVVFSQHLFQAFFGCVDEKKLSRMRVRIGAIADDDTFESPTLKQ